MIKSYDENGNRIGHVVEGPEGQELYRWHGRWHFANAYGEEKELENEAAAELARQWGEELPY